MFRYLNFRSQGAQKKNMALHYNILSFLWHSYPFFNTLNINTFTEVEKNFKYNDQRSRIEIHLLGTVSTKSLCKS